MFIDLMVRFSKKVVLNSVSRSRINALRVFSVPAFKRKLYSSKVRVEAINFLKKKLNNDFFESLPRFMSDFHVPSYNVRRFVFKGREFVVKDTKGDFFEGFVNKGEEHGVRKFMKAHHSFFRKNKLRVDSKYILRTPKLIASIGDFLVLERINPWYPKSISEKKLVELGYQGFRVVFEQVYNESNLLRPQITDFIPAGIHNGKVVLYSVYDYA